MKLILLGTFFISMTLLSAQETETLSSNNTNVAEGKMLYISPVPVVDVDAEMRVQLASSPERTIPKDANQSKEAKHGY
ncbi:MAG TPA: hypothetical protein VEZ39_05485 [Sulfuricurvum sp.]|nr:hypothetical protein [Sulfuricurvum sp.]